VLALADVAVVVSNAKASSKWWEEKMGFEVRTVGGGTHAVVTGPPGDRLILHLCEGFAPGEPGNTGIAFITDQIDRDVARMTAAGVEFPAPLDPKEGGQFAQFADPDGNVFWLIGVPTKMVRETLRTRAKKPAVARSKHGRSTRKQRRR
jgi:catechol 2,3-dioxygenase-like lactoylglutathione lyase family enzyme